MSTTVASRDPVQRFRGSIVDVVAGRVFHGHVARVIEDADARGPVAPGDSAAQAQ